MGKKLKEVLKGIARTMDLSPPDPPTISPQDRIERLRQPWVRTGQAIQRSVDQYAREQATS